MNARDHYFEQQQEPIKSTLYVLRNLILKRKNVTERWSYGMPFYYINGKRFCYLWVHKKFKQPYLGFIDGKKIVHPDLLKEKRSRIKILLVDPAKDVPVKKINALLEKITEMYH